MVELDWIRPEDSQDILGLFLPFLQKAAQCNGFDITQIDISHAKRFSIKIVFDHVVLIADEWHLSTFVPQLTTCTTARLHLYLRFQMTCWPEQPTTPQVLRT